MIRLITDDDDDELMNCLCGIVDLGRAFTPYFKPGPFLDIFIIVSL